MSNLSATAHPVTLDASFVIGLCAKEPKKVAVAQTELSQRILDGCSLHAPHLLIMEAAYVLCGKQQSGELTQAEHTAAIANLRLLSTTIIFPDIRRYGALGACRAAAPGVWMQSISRLLLYRTSRTLDLARRVGADHI